MGFQAKRELLMQTGARYSEADGPLKSKILDEFVLATGYDRKYATRLLNPGSFNCRTTPTAPPMLNRAKVQ